MTEMITWLRAQLDTDEQTARLASGVVEMFIAPRQNGKTVVSAFLRINTPERTLRQVQAHRAILDDLAAVIEDDEGHNYFSDGHAGLHVAKRTLRLLVSIYSDRDGFRAEWSA